MKLCYLRREVLRLEHRREREELQRKNGLVSESLSAEGKKRHQGYTSRYVEERFLLVYVPNSEQ